MKNENEILKNLKEINERQKEKEEIKDLIYSSVFKSTLIFSSILLVILIYNLGIKPTIQNYKINKNKPAWVQEYNQKKIIHNQNTYYVQFKYNAQEWGGEHVSTLKVTNNQGRIISYNDMELNTTKEDLNKKILKEIEIWE